MKETVLEFCHKVKGALEGYIGGDATVSIQETVKNNGVVLHGLSIKRPGSNLATNVYLDGLYREYLEGEGFGVVMGRVMDMYEESAIQGDVDISFFLEYEKMKERVVYKVISRERNEKLLGEVPWVPFLDMAVVFYCHMQGDRLGRGTVMVRNSHLDMWGIAKERLYGDAARNTASIMPARIFPVGKLVEDIISGKGVGEPVGQDLLEWLDGGERMFVLCNDKRMFGAATVLYEGLLEGIRERLGKNLFVLPSSVHEVILVPDGVGRKAAGKLHRMVREVNATGVKPEDVLTDSVYYFFGECGKLEKIC